jgi:selenocysteine-specific elongation factor
MKHAIIGTAGHIDHGKTSLVRALTGVDTDRLKEEKQRGITIDIGFADLDLDGVQIGFVDVPGHERFVKNMLAGAHGIDFVLLVVAADESVMPQTREHFDICRLLGVRSGAIALTKCDLVDPELLELAHAEVEDFVEGSFLEGAPIVAVSSTTGQGVDELKRVLAQLAAGVPDRATDRPFRLPVDRVFTIRGFGTVVTGTLIAGRVATGETVEAVPAGRKARVRGLQVHGTTTDRAVAGQRTAVNLQGVDVDELTRGQVLASAGRFRATSMVDVRIRVLENAPRPVRQRARVRFHHGTAEAIARVLLIGRDDVTPGEEAIAQVRLESPVLALPGDRFIIRSYSPQVTIGGGVVLDALAPKHRRSDIRALDWIERLEASDERERARLRLERAGVRGLGLAELASQSGLADAVLQRYMRELVDEKRAVMISEAPQQWIDVAADRALRDRVLAAVRDFHKREPLAPGLPMEELRSTLFSSSGVEVFRAVTGALIAERKLERDLGVARLPGRTGVFSAEDKAAKDRLEATVRDTGLEASTLDEIATRLAIPEGRARKLHDLLVREGRLLRLGDLVYHVEPLAALKTRVRERGSAGAVLDVAAFKELAGGLSRKYMIPLLEWLDRERVTRRVGDKREIL